MGPFAVRQDDFVANLGMCWYMPMGADPHDHFYICRAGRCAPPRHLDCGLTPWPASARSCKVVNPLLPFMRSRVECPCSIPDPPTAVPALPLAMPGGLAIMGAMARLMALEPFLERPHPWKPRMARSGSPACWHRPPACRRSRTSMDRCITPMVAEEDQQSPWTAKSGDFRLLKLRTETIQIRRSMAQLSGKGGCDVHLLQPHYVGRARCGRTGEGHQVRRKARPR